MSSKCKKCGSTDNYNFALNVGLCDVCIGKKLERITELETEIREVSNQLSDLYELCSETTEPAVYGTILGLHERLELALKGGD